MSNFPTRKQWLKAARAGDVACLHEWRAAGLFDPANVLHVEAIEKEDSEGLKETALHRAIQSGHPAYALCLLGLMKVSQQPNGAGETALHLACRACNPILVQAMLEQGFDANATSRLGEQSEPLVSLLKNSPRILAEPDPAEYAQWILRALACAHLLLEHGADPSPKDAPTAVWWAADRRLPELLQFFLDAGVPPDARPEDPKHETPLHVVMARWEEKSHLDPANREYRMLHSLMAAGADPFALVKDHTGPRESALDICAWPSGRKMLLYLWSSRQAQKLAVQVAPAPAKKPTNRL